MVDSYLERKPSKGERREVKRQDSSGGGRATHSGETKRLDKQPLAPRFGAALVLMLGEKD